MARVFSSSTGGVGFRIGYDLRLFPVTRLIAGTEFISNGLEASLNKLRSDLPPNATRVTLVATPVGLQRQFYPRKRVVPHVGFGAGPYIRTDHLAAPAGFYSGYGGIGMSGGTLGSRSGYSASLALPFDGNTSLSLTMGGFAAAGFDVRFGAKKDLAVTVDALGTPGDLGGPSLSVGVGKYF